MYHAMLCIRPSTDIHCTSTAQVTMLSRAVYSGSGGRGGGCHPAGWDVHVQVLLLSMIYQIRLHVTHYILLIYEHHDDCPMPSSTRTNHWNYTTSYKPKHEFSRLLLNINTPLELATEQTDHAKTPLFLMLRSVIQGFA